MLSYQLALLTSSASKVFLTSIQSSYDWLLFLLFVVEAIAFTHHCYAMVSEEELICDFLVFAMNPLMCHHFAPLLRS